MRNKIQIRIPRSAEGRVIRISPAAEAVLAELQRTTRLPISQMASQMIIQGADFVEIIEEDDNANS